jgi:hypothetical protein
MSYRMMSRLFTLAALVLLMAPLAWGQTAVKKSGANKPIVETIKFSEPTTVNGTTIQPGEYRIVAHGDTLQVEDVNDKVLAESPISWRRLDHTIEKTKLDIDKGVLTKVELGGTHEVVLLHHSST